MIEFQGTFSLLPNRIYSFQNAQVAGYNLSLQCAMGRAGDTQRKVRLTRELRRRPVRSFSASGLATGRLFWHLVPGTGQSWLGQATLPDGHTHDSI